MEGLPESMRWLFWDVDFDALDGDTQADAIAYAPSPRVRSERAHLVHGLRGATGRHVGHRSVPPLSTSAIPSARYSGAVQQSASPASCSVNVALVLLVLLAAMTLCSGCKDAAFATKYEPGFRREGRTVAVFGVYKDGRMNGEAWSDIGPRISAALGGAPCESLHGGVLVALDPAVADAVDDKARADGVTDGLLDLFAPAAPADAILVVSLAGRLPTTSGPAVSSPPPQMAARNPRALGARGAGGAGGGISPVESGGPGLYALPDALEISARLFSVREHRTVAIVAMTYSGKKADEAIASFIAKLRTELPGMTCQPWNHEVHVEADRVREARPSE